MFPDQYKSLKLVSDCPVCRRKNFPSDIKMVEEGEDAHLLHVRCRNCGGCIMVLVSFGLEGMNVFGVLTDLGPEEAGSVMKRGPLSADDVLKVHEVLHGKNFFSEMIK
ncbi:MAG: hypothetical protein V1928_03645 [Parcubacteria group bacterium]